MLGGYYGEESIDIEFKQFCNQFPYVLEENFNENELEDLILNGTWSDNLNDLINRNIISYMSYIPQKYISCFGNSKINGSLIIGIDDSGEITGIPYKENLNKEYIYSLLENTVKENVISEYMTSQDILSKISIEVIKLNVMTELLTDDIVQIYDIFKKARKKQAEENLLYKDSFKIWFNELSIYTGKLYNLINNDYTRNRLIKYINKKCSNEEIKTSLINLLKTKKTIDLPDGIRILTDRKKIDNIIYWLADFKDYNVKEILKKKPKKKIIALKNIYHLVGNFSFMRKKFVDNNINHYIIKINIEGNKFNDDIRFKYPLSSKEYYRKRTEIEGFPCCF